MLIGLCSLKSSPGVSTAALTLAGCWPPHLEAPIVIELDSRGGDVASRYGLATDPGLRSLAAAARLSAEPGMVRAHAQPVGGSAVPVVVAPCERDQARQAVVAMSVLLDGLRDAAAPVLLDLGEVDPNRPGTSDLLGSLTLLLVVARAVPEQIARLRGAAKDLLRASRRVQVLFIGDTNRQESADLVGLPVAGVLPLVDPDAGAVARVVHRGVRRAFGTTAISVAAELAALVELSTPAMATPASLPEVPR